MKRRAGYGWIIDRDHLAYDLGSVDHDDRDDTGTIGPRNIYPSIKAQLRAGEGEKFRMYDDDGELYYEGRIVFHPDYEAPDMQFEPLDDFGMPNAGCTTIKYRNRNTGKWEVL